jgi:ribosome recycling factor
MNSEKIIKESREKMVKAIDYTLHEFSTLHTGKASPTMLDGIQVTVQAYGGASSSIKDIAAVTTPDSRTVKIQPWDKAVVADITRAIQKANLGFHPVAEGNNIRISIPELSGDRRKELVKVAHNMAEEGRIRVRHVRREAMDALKSIQKLGEISEDELKRDEKDIQAETNKNIAEIDRHLNNKEKELTSI